MLKDINEKISHVVQLLWNCLAVHVHILQPSNSTPSHVPWRNSCPCQPGDTPKNVYCIFIIAKKTTPKHGNYSVVPVHLQENGYILE